MFLPALILITQTALLAQPAENPIPPSGGAIKFADSVTVSELPHALDAGWKGERVCEPLYENASMRAARCTFPPGVGHEKHFHPPHFGYVVEGGIMEITDADGTRKQETPTGASWWSDGIAWHEAVNVGDTTAVYLIVEPKDAAARPPFRPALKTHLDAIVAKDIVAYEPTITTREDLHLVFPDGSIIETTDGVVSFHEDWFEDANWRWNSEVVKILEGADMSAAFMKYDYRDTPEGEPRSAWLVLIFAFENGAWRLVHDQNTRIESEGRE